MMNKLKQTIDKILDDVYERRLKTMSYEAEDMIIAEIEDLDQILDLIREEQQAQCVTFWAERTLMYAKSVVRASLNLIARRQLTTINTALNVGLRWI